MIDKKIVAFEFAVVLKGPTAYKYNIDTHISEIFNWYQSIAFQLEMGIKLTFKSGGKFTGMCEFDKKDAINIESALKHYVNADKYGMFPIIIDDSPYIIIGNLLSITNVDI